MLASGLVEEVRGLLAQGLEANPSAARGIGYREVIALLQGRLAPENLAAEIIRNTRALVKKQRTWFSNPAAAPSGRAGGELGEQRRTLFPA